MFLEKLVRCCSLLILLPACAASVRAEPLTFQGDPRLTAPLAKEQFIPHFTGGGGAWESWEYAFRFPTGHTILSQFQVSSVGPGSHRGLAVGVVIGPDGTTALLKNGRERDAWKLEALPDGAEIQIAKHKLRMTPPAHHLHMQNSRGTFTLEAVSTGPPVQPGRLKLDKDEFFDLTILAPRLKVKGTLQLPGGPVQDLGEGTGIALHVHSNLADYKIADSWMRFHTFDKDLQLSIYEFTGTKDLKRQRVGFFMALEGGKLVFHSYDFTRKYTSLEKDPEKPGYPVPTALEFADVEGKHSVRGQAKLQLKRRDDLLDWLDSGIARFVVRQVSHPVQYFFDAQYEAVVDLGQGERKFSGVGIANVTILNKPPKDGLW